jgi:hypothetical protein
MTARWAEVQRLHARLTALAAQPPEPRQAAHHARVPPSPSPQATRPTGPRTGTRRDASGGRAGGGRPWPPTPDHSSRAPAQTGPPGGGAWGGCRRHLSRRSMTRARGPRSRRWSPGWSRLGGRVPTVDQPLWPRSRGAWRPARPWRPRWRGWPPHGDRPRPSVTRAGRRSGRRGLGCPAATAPGRLSAGGCTGGWPTGWRSAGRACGVAG